MKEQKMKIFKRYEALLVALGTPIAFATDVRAASPNSAKTTPGPNVMPIEHDMSAFARLPGAMENERIVFVTYPGFTLLDLVGPQYMLGGIPDIGPAIAPTVTFAECPRDVVPGGGFSPGVRSACFAPADTISTHPLLEPQRCTA